MQRSHDYRDKALRGNLEELDSRERVITEDQYRKKRKAEGCSGKFERYGFQVKQTGTQKIVDGTQDYSTVLKEVEKQLQDDSS